MNSQRRPLGKKNNAMKSKQKVASLLKCKETVSNEGGKVLNIHQLRVLERMKQRKEAKEKKETLPVPLKTVKQSTSRRNSPRKRNFNTRKEQNSQGNNKQTPITATSSNVPDNSIPSTSLGKDTSGKKDIKNVTNKHKLHNETIANKQAETSPPVTRRNRGRSRNVANQRLEKLQKSLEVEENINKSESKQKTYEPPTKKLKNFIIPKKQNVPVDITPRLHDQSHQLECTHTTPDTSSNSILPKADSSKNLINVWNELMNDKNDKSTNVERVASTENCQPTLIWDKCRFFFNESAIHSSTPKVHMENKITFKRKRDDTINEEKSPLTIPITSQSLVATKRCVAARRKNRAERRLLNFRKSLTTDSKDNNNQEAKELSSNTNDSQNSIVIDQGLEDSSCSNGVFAFSSGEKNTSGSVCDEEMEWEIAQSALSEIKAFLSIPNKVTLSDVTVDDTKPITIVVDTNILLRHIDLIKLLSSGDYPQVKVIIPWVVFNELDKLKSSKLLSLEVQARKAINFLHKELPNNRISGQSLESANQHLFECESPDDEILNCCLQLNQQSRVLLFSNDINLCNKATVNNVANSTHDNFESVCLKQFNFKITKPRNVSNDRSFENIPKFKPKEFQTIYDKSEFYQKLQKILIEDLSLILKDEMTNKFGDIWKKIILIEPPWNLKDIMKCFNKHWIAVFSDILPKDAFNSIGKLQKLCENSLNMDQHKLESFYVCCVEFLNCFLTTSYRPIVSQTLKRMQDLKNSGGKVSVKVQSVQSNENNNVEDDAPFNEPVLDISITKNAFKNVLDGLGTYCCNLANHFNIAHNLNFSTSQLVPLSNLLPQADAVGNQLQIMMSTLMKLLSTKQRILGSKPMDKDSIAALENVLSVILDTLQGIGKTDVLLNIHQLKSAFGVERNIFEECYSSLSILHGIMLQCSAKYATIQFT